MYTLSQSYQLPEFAGMVAIVLPPEFVWDLSMLVVIDVLVGTSVAALGILVGILVGTLLGNIDGIKLDKIDGLLLGITVGKTLGLLVASIVGSTVGALLGAGSLKNNI